MPDSDPPLVYTTKEPLVPGSPRIVWRAWCVHCGKLWNTNTWWDARQCAVDHWERDHD